MSGHETIAGAVSETSLEVVRERPTSMLAPIVGVERALEVHRARRRLIDEVLELGIHYGPPYPGSEKRTLLLPGAEALAGLFGLSIRFELLERTEDITGADHGGEPVYAYTYRCRLLTRAGDLITEADASCTSLESRYRYRLSERTCPSCGGEGAITKGKAEYGGGWLCWVKKGGCGAKFADGDQVIESQRPGRVPNPDVADCANTVMAMAQKRAYVRAVRCGTGCSDIFTDGYSPPLGDDPAAAPPPEPSPDQPAAEPATEPAEHPRPQASAREPSPPATAGPDGGRLDLEPAALKGKKRAAAEQILEVRDLLSWEDQDVLEVLGAPSMVDATLADLERTLADMGRRQPAPSRTG